MNKDIDTLQNLNKEIIYIISLKNEFKDIKNKEDLISFLIKHKEGFFKSIYNTIMKEEEILLKEKLLNNCDESILEASKEIFKRISNSRINSKISIIKNKLESIDLINIKLEYSKDIINRLINNQEEFCKKIKLKIGFPSLKDIIIKNINGNHKNLFFSNDEKLKSKIKNLPEELRDKITI